MTDFNYYLNLQGETLAELAATTIAVSLWRKSLENRDIILKVLFECPNSEKDSSALSTLTLQEYHSKALIEQEQLPVCVKSLVLKFVSRICSDIRDFLVLAGKRVSILSHDSRLALGIIQLSDNGTVSRSKSFRAALPFISDRFQRFAIISEYAMIDLLDDAWNEIRSWVDYETMSRNWVPNILLLGVGDNIYVTYFKCLKLGKLRELTEALHETIPHLYSRHPHIAGYLLQCAAYGSLEAVKHFLPLVPPGSRLTSLTSIFGALGKHIYQTRRDYDLDYHLTNYIYLLNQMTDVERDAIYQLYPNHLILCWAYSDRLSHLTIPAAKRMFGYMTDNILLWTLGDFLCFDSRVVTRIPDAIFLQYLKEMPENSRNVLYSHADWVLTIMLIKEHEFVKELLINKGPGVLFEHGLNLCVYLVVKEKDKWQYIHVFMMEVVPFKYREEFQTKLGKRIQDVLGIDSEEWVKLQKVFTNVGRGLDSFHSCFLSMRVFSTNLFTINGLVAKPISPV